MRHLKFKARGISQTVRFTVDGELHMEDDNTDPIDEVVKLVRGAVKDPEAQFSKIKFTPIKSKGAKS